MLGLAAVLTDFIDLAGYQGGELGLAAVDRLGLDSVVDLAPANVVGSGAEGFDGLGVRSSTRGTNHNALEVFG